MNQKKLEQINATPNHNQAGFDNPFINGRGFIYLGISKLSFTL